MSEVHDLGEAIIDNEPVEHRHLALDFIEIGDGRQVWKIVLERVTTGIEIEHDGIVVAEALEIDQKPRHEGFADLRSRRGYYEDRSLFFFFCERRAATGRALTVLAQSRRCFLLAVARRHVALVSLGVRMPRSALSAIDGPHGNPRKRSWSILSPGRQLVN